MRFYRNEYYSTGGCHDGFGWFTSRAEAVKAARARNREINRIMHDEYAPVNEADILTDKDIAQPIDIEPTKAGILRALKRYASRPDNG